jgi:predicted AlkP superfamily pyrophosphatase or phosphodiesterase
MGAESNRNKSMRKTVVINVVGLTQSLIGKHTPFLEKWIKAKQLLTVEPTIPAVTCTMQATYLTGQLPSQHGIVGNGWYSREDAEVKFWKQSNKLIQVPIIWDILKKENQNFSACNMFWWYNMYSGADYAVTPRPLYPADGRKLPDCYTSPMDLRERLTQALGIFPLFDFWGPKTSIKSSQWIAEASILVDKWHNPTLSFIYLPHLDYNGQRHTYQHPSIEKDLSEIDAVLEQLVLHFESANAEIIILSEYGITPVSKPIHINRILREAQYITIKQDLGLEYLDAGASEAFAVADHQIAHVYLKNPSKMDELIKLFAKMDGIEKILVGEDKRSAGLDHDRAGDIVLVANKDSWFTYYYWLDDALAPDYACTVDIHRKPGYDPVEMFLDRSNKFIFLKLAYKLLRKKLGFRYLMDVIPLDASLVKGSHGRIPASKADWPVFIGNDEKPIINHTIKATEVFQMIYDTVKYPNTEL